jgi:hypothetical protein
MIVDQNRSLQTHSIRPSRNQNRTQPKLHTMNAPVPMWLLLLVVLLLTGAFWPLVKTAICCVVFPILYLIRWWPITLGLVLAWSISISIWSDQNFENEATQGHPVTRVISADRYHRPEQVWIHGNFRHSLSGMGYRGSITETIERIN